MKDFTRIDVEGTKIDFFELRLGVLISKLISGSNVLKPDGDAFYDV